MVTEQGIAKSAAVLDVVAARLGNGVTAEELRSNVEVSGDTNGTIVKIEYVAPTRQQAVDAADAIANAYLTERTALVEQRADEMAAGVNEQIEALETELASLQPLADEEGNTKDNPRATEIRTALTKLAKDAEQLAPYHATAGRVITPAASSSDEVSPSKSRLILITTVVGVFVGLVLVLIRETRSRSLTSPTQLADLTALPVWSAEEGAPEPWLAPTRMLAMAIDRDHWVDLIVDASDPQARDLHRVLSASLAETRVPAPRLIDINQPPPSPPPPRPPPPPPPRRERVDLKLQHVQSVIRPDELASRSGLHFHNHHVRDRVAFLDARPAGHAVRQVRLKPARQERLNRHMLARVQLRRIKHGHQQQQPPTPPRRETGQYARPSGQQHDPPCQTPA